MTTSDRILVLSATRAGLFIFSTNNERREWERAGPFLAENDIYHAAYDPRDGSIWAAANGPRNQIFRSPDLGLTWEAKGEPFECESIWHVEPGHSSSPRTVFAGVKPAALWKSCDSGETWQAETSLNAHETREDWWEGGGGLCLNTIILPEDRPGRIYAGISVAGLFRSEDDGETWRPVNSGIADFYETAIEVNGPIRHESVHRCVHKVVLHPTDPEIMFQQNHLGVYRSEDGGDSWTSIGEGLPSLFGFPIAVGNSNGSVPPIYVIPEDEETLRTKERLAVWRSDDEGQSWNEFTDGLPAGHLNVNREGMAAGTLSPTGVYLGSTTGQLYGSTDGGTKWTAIADDLPPIRSVKIGQPA
jgi:photosystem II stability/assembly factor-like uncharacterized protein